MREWSEGRQCISRSYATKVPKVYWSCIVEMTVFFSDLSQCRLIRLKILCTVGEVGVTCCALLCSVAIHCRILPEFESNGGMRISHFIKNILAKSQYILKQFIKGENAEFFGVSKQPGGYRARQNLKSGQPRGRTRIRMLNLQSPKNNLITP